MTKDSTYRATDAYLCSYYGCGEGGVMVETRPVRPNGMAGSLGFYGWCADHAPKEATR